jgi:hypothetical protein
MLAKKNSMRRWLYFLPWILFLIAFFVIVFTSYGAETLIIDSNQTGGDLTQSGYGQSFSTSSTFLLSKISLYVGLNTATPSPNTTTIFLILGTPSGLGNTPGGTALASSTITTSTENAWVDFPFSNIEITAATTYSFTIPTGYTTGATQTGQSGGTYAAGQGYANTIGYPGPLHWAVDSPEVDMAFKIYGNLPTSDINFIIPSSTPSLDFDYWLLNYNFVGGTPIGGPGEPQTGLFLVHYGQTTSTMTLLDDSYFFLWTSSTPIIAKTNALMPGTWYAKTEFFNASSSLVASSTISFTILSPGALPVPTSTILTATSSCEAGNFFENGACYLFNYLFIPSQSSVNRFGNLTDTLNKKPPIGYFTAIKTAFNSIATTTTSTFALADISAITGSPVALLRTGLTWILWIVLGFWIFNRFRHFDFHL